MSDHADDAIDNHPWLEPVTQLGWIAKAVVYGLMGYTAIRIATVSSTSDNASPNGAIGVLADAPLGRLILGALTVGLTLYVIWRALSVAVISGSDLSAWGDRVGYSFSAIFYVTLAWAAGKASATGLDPEESSSVESLSTSVMEVTAGRTMVGIAGLVTIAVGIYFLVHKGVQRSFTSDLKSVDDSLSGNERKRQIVLVAGVVGWICRGVVTMLVGFFVLRAAWRFDPNEARGFDKALREVAQNSAGGVIVFGCGVGLIAYALFCFASHRFRRLDDHDHG